MAKSLEKRMSEHGTVVSRGWARERERESEDRRGRGPKRGGTKKGSIHNKQFQTTTTTTTNNDRDSGSSRSSKGSSSSSELVNMV